MLLCEDVHPHQGHYILRRTRRCMCSIKHYMSTLETKVKSQDEEINKLKESNGELNDSNRMMSSRIDTLGEYFDLLPALPLNNCIILPALPLNNCCIT